MSSSTLKVIPSSTAATQASIESTATEYGTHDTLRYGVRSLRHEITQTHPLEASLRQWRATQTQTRNQLHRRLYGLHAPIRSTMERRIVSEISRFQNPTSLAHSNLALDILEGRDETLDVEDFLGDMECHRPATVDVHTVLSRQLGL
ncbi:hypothetical protein IWQ60_010485 [Tieghemiomyces parasiticus]|uniref:Proteasome maturation factor UMP1 n=1 Tax=Tieghemiomyces parasiticus TaxID=78921 RepID=A0A9W7ZRD1_9FUNG|nr:hypothetical protein IWQ60_010485 [Tieghemiomyces parasiticus]